MSATDLDESTISNTNDEYPVEIIREKKNMIFVYVIPDEDDACYRFSKDPTSGRLKCLNCVNINRRSIALNYELQSIVLRKSDGFSLNKDPKRKHIEGCSPDYYSKIEGLYEIQNDDSHMKQSYTFPLLQMRRPDKYSLLYRLENDPTKCYRFEYQWSEKSTICLSCTTCSTITHDMEDDPCYHHCSSSGFTDDPCHGHLDSCQPIEYDDVIRGKELLEAKLKRRYIDKLIRGDRKISTETTQNRNPMDSGQIAEPSNRLVLNDVINEKFNVEEKELQSIEEITAIVKEVDVPEVIEAIPQNICGAENEPMNMEISPVKVRKSNERLKSAIISAIESSSSYCDVGRPQPKKYCSGNTVPVIETLNSKTRRRKKHLKESGNNPSTSANTDKNTTTITEMSSFATRLRHIGENSELISVSPSPLLQTPEETTLSEDSLEMKADVLPTFEPEVITIDDDYDDITIVDEILMNPPTDMPKTRTEPDFSQTFPVPFFNFDDLDVKLNGQSVIIELEKKGDGVKSAGAHLQYSVQLAADIDPSTVETEWIEGKVKIIAWRYRTPVA